MICARKGLYGMLWQVRKGDGDELIQAWEYARAKYGADALTGKVLGREPELKELEQDESLPKGTWLFELKAQP
jgi:hypothetical protein